MTLFGTKHDLITGLFQSTSGTFERSHVPVTEDTRHAAKLDLVLAPVLRKKGNQRVAEGWCKISVRFQKILAESSTVSLEAQFGTNRAPIAKKFRFQTSRVNDRPIRTNKH